MKDELKRFLLPLNLQHFAEEDGTNPDGTGEGEEPPDKKGQTTDNTGGEPGKETDVAEDNKTINMTQEEFNKVISDRLARERKKQDENEQKVRDEEERKRLKDNEEYKGLADKLQKQLDEQKVQSADVKKSSLLTQAGYTEEEINYLKSTVKGDNDEELKASVEDLKKAIPPVKKEYADPSANNSRRDKPEKVGGEEVGKSAFERVKGRLRR